MRAAPLIVLLCWCCSEAARPRTGRDWGKMTDKDWERIEDEWETPEEKEERETEMAPPKSKGIDLEKLQETMKKQKKGKKGADKEVQRMLAESQQTSGPAMMFATLDYEGCCTKKETEKIGTQWGALLASAGMNVQTYVIEDDQVLFSTQAGLHANEIRDFVSKQPECVFVEWNQQRTQGPAETPEWKAKDAANKAKKEAERESKKAEDEAVKKAEEKAKRKRKATKKAKKAGKVEL
mmetsp:Transcript_27244/g.69249  ORF Transcript_27244/g.69249 Transcript_27244/m.69249 type:complete len:237 (+) Transcript_27244:81-791(+)